MKLVRIALIISLVVQVVVGLTMVLTPSLMARLIYVPEPNVFIQAIGSVALSLGLLCWLALQNLNKKGGTETAYITFATLLLFNVGLTLFLGIGAYYHYISWLGLIVHLPLIVLCVLALNTIARKKLT